MTEAQTRTARRICGGLSQILSTKKVEYVSESIKDGTYSIWVIIDHAPCNLDSLAKLATQIGVA